VGLCFGGGTTGTLTWPGQACILLDVKHEMTSNGFDTFVFVDFGAACGRVVLCASMISGATYALGFERGGGEKSVDATHQQGHEVGSNGPSLMFRAAVAALHKFGRLDQTRVEMRFGVDVSQLGSISLPSAHQNLPIVVYMFDDGWGWEDREAAYKLISRDDRVQLFITCVPGGGSLDLFVLEVLAHLNQDRSNRFMCASYFDGRMRVSQNKKRMVFFTTRSN
jgi:hypothetical protein